MAAGNQLWHIIYLIPMEQAMVEIVFGVLGLVMLVSGKIPQNLFQMLFGKGYYEAPASTARWFGLLMLTPAPLVVLGTALAGALLGGTMETYVPWVEVLVLCTVAVIALLWARKFHQDTLPDAKPALNHDELPQMPAAGMPAGVTSKKTIPRHRRVLFVMLIFTAILLVPMILVITTRTANSDPAYVMDWSKFTIFVVVLLLVVTAIIARSVRATQKAISREPEGPAVPTPVAEEEPKDVFELSDREIRQKLGLEAPDPADAAPPPPPDPVEAANRQGRRILLMVIGLLAGLGAPLLILLAFLSDDALATRSLQDILAIFGISGFAIIMAIVLVLFFARQTRKK